MRPQLKNAKSDAARKELTRRAQNIITDLQRLLRDVEECRKGRPTGPILDGFAAAMRRLADKF